jgi:hypothetical protein
MAHSHYVMDLYFPDGHADAMRREVLRITAADDDEAMSEASRINGWRQPARYEVRAITKAARANHRVVFASVVAEPAPEEDAEPPEGPVGVEQAPHVDTSP